MDIKELQTMCYKASSRFSSFKDREELTQIGVLACLEHLKIDPNADPIKLYFVAKNAMWIDVNIDELPVKIPRYRKVVSIARGEDTSQWDNLSEDNREEIKRAVKSLKVPLEQAENVPVDDAFNTIFGKEQKAIVREAIFNLDQKLQDVIFLRMSGHTLQSISDKLGISKEAVRKREENAMESLRLALLPHRRRGSL